MKRLLKILDLHALLIGFVISVILVGIFSTITFTPNSFSLNIYLLAGIMAFLVILQPILVTRAIARKRTGNNAWSYYAFNSLIAVSYGIICGILIFDMLPRSKPIITHDQLLKYVDDLCQNDWLIEGNHSGMNDSIHHEYNHHLNYTFTAHSGNLPKDLENLILKQAPEYFNSRLKTKMHWKTGKPDHIKGSYSHDGRNGRIEILCTRVSDAKIGIKIDFEEH